MSLKVQNLTPKVSWVKKILGERCGEVGLVFSVNVQDNCFSVTFQGDKKPTFACNPEEFRGGEKHETSQLKGSI